MIRRNFFLLIIILSAATLKAQNGEIAGKAINEKGEGISKIQITVTDITGNVIGKGFISDSDGNFSVKPLPSGIYNLEFSCRGYLPLTEHGLIVKTDRSTFIHVQLASAPKLKKKGTK